MLRFETGFTVDKSLLTEIIQPVDCDSPRLLDGSYVAAPENKQSVIDCIQIDKKP